MDMDKLISAAKTLAEIRAERAKVWAGESTDDPKHLKKVERLAIRQIIESVTEEM